MWSEKNKKLVKALTENGKMTASGIAAVELAKKGGQRNTREALSISEEQVGILISALSGASLALSNFMKMPHSGKKNLYRVVFRCKRKEPG